MVEKQESVQDSLNLQYLVADKRASRLSRPLIVFGLVSLGVITFLGWLAVHSRREMIVLHRVSKGDNLRSLAILYYKNPRQWHKIYLANREKLLHQKKLLVGQKLRIPLSEKQFERIIQKKQIPK